MGDHLKSGSIRSCGCLNRETQKNNKNNLKHGMSHTRFFRIWRGPKIRCLNSNGAWYKNYGGRGITVCDRWLVFENFRDEMYESYLQHVEEYGEKQTTLDRINNDLGYCKENCRWATYSEQINNRRTKNPN